MDGKDITSTGPSEKTGQQSICSGAEQGGSDGWATLVTII